MGNILFTPYKINGLEIKNRIIMSAMHLGYAENKKVSKKDIEFYRARAKGGAGAIVVVAGVNDLAGPPEMHSVYEDKYIDGMRELSDTVHEHDCKLFVQLFHGGRNGHPLLLGGKDPVAPSAIPSPIYKITPKEMTIEDIKSTIEDFGQAALRCKKAGADGVEISCSAGYLLTQFLSHLVNKRTDEYGGSKENRMRFPKEVIKRIRECVGDNYPVAIRISGSDMLPGGYGVDYMQEFCSSIEPGLIDVINVTGGWHEAPVPQITPQVPEGGYAFLAGAIKRVVDIPVAASNRINNGEIAEEILQKGLADFVSVGRAFLADPEFANKVKEGKTYNKCQACNKGCIERALKGLDVRCAFNVRTGIEYRSEKKLEMKKKVLVIGSGPAGMEAARSAARKGHEVILCTKEDKLGGLLSVAAIPPHKQDILKFIENMGEELKELKVDIKFNTNVDDKFISSMKPDYVIVATGSTPIIPSIEGVDKSNVYFAEDVLTANKDFLVKLRKGKTVIIGGNAVGLETAHYLAEQSFVNSGSMDFINEYVPMEIVQNIYSPVDITVVEMEKKAGKNLGGVRWIIKNQLKKLGVKVMTNTKVIAIKDAEISVAIAEEERCFPADNIILAIGYKSSGSDLIKYLEENHYDYKVVGDSKKPSDAMEALKEGYKAGSKI